VLGGCPFDFILLPREPEGAFKSDELSLLESLGDLREFPPGIDAMPFDAGFILCHSSSFPGDVEDDVLAVVLSGFGFCVLSEAADEDDFVDYVELGRFANAIRDATTGCRAPAAADVTMG
jgi:hypothetical protein